MYFNLVVLHVLVLMLESLLATYILGLRNQLYTVYSLIPK